MKEDFSIIEKLEQVSVFKFVSTFKPIFVQVFPDFVRILNRKKEVFQLRKFLSLEYVDIVFLPNEIFDLDGRKREENLEQFRSEINKAVKAFDEIITTKMPHFNRVFLYKNLETLLIKEVEFIEKNIEALYDHDSNTIFLLIDIGLRHIFHELFHLASFRKYDNIVSCGFMQFVEGNTQSLIGRGLTEGYTQILTERYFAGYNIEKNNYFHLMHFSSHLELIVGRKKMETLYSNAGLYYLIEDLEQYETREHILEFLKNLDIIELLSGKTKGAGDFRKAYCQKAIRDVLSFLVKCRTLQLKKQFDSGIISECDLEIAVNSFLDSLTQTDFKNLYGDIYELDLIEEDFKVIDEILYQVTDDVELLGDYKKCV